MRPWNLYNASMEIVSRCNSFFSKLFIYRVMRFNGLTIDANPRYKFPAPYNIHMIADKGGNKLEVYLNFYGMYSLSNCDDGDLERIGRNRQTLWGGCTAANPKLLLNDT